MGSHIFELFNYFYLHYLDCLINRKKYILIKFFNFNNPLNCEFGTSEERHTDKKKI